MKKNFGFSLVELMMVINIIGALSAIILNSVSNSRARAYDSKIKQQLSSFRVAAEMYFLNQMPNSYSLSVDCSSGMFNDVDSQNGSPSLYIAPGNLPDFSIPVCQSTESSYAVKAPLYSGNEYWCVDSKGASRLIEGAIDGPSTFCP